MGSDNHGPRNRGRAAAFLSPTQIFRDVIMIFIGCVVATHYRNTGTRFSGEEQQGMGDATDLTSDASILRTSQLRTALSVGDVNQQQQEQTRHPQQQWQQGQSDTRNIVSSALPDGWHPIYVYYGARTLLTDSIPEKWRVLGVPKNSHPTKSKEWFGQHGQDVAVAKFFNFKRDGFFVDLASNDAVWASNTYALETNYGWRGICIEPNPYYWFRLSFRRCHALGAMVGGQNLDEVQVQLSYSKVQGPYGGIIGDKFDNKKETKDTERRYTASLEHIFESFDAPKVIDYISLDVEGAEDLIMGVFPFDKYCFLTMSIERPKDELRKLLKDKGYSHVLDFKRGDTLWAHRSVYQEGKKLVEQNRHEIDAHVVDNLQKLE